MFLNTLCMSRLAGMTGRKKRQSVYEEKQAHSTPLAQVPSCHTPPAIGRSDNTLSTQELSEVATWFCKWTVLNYL